MIRRFCKSASNSRTIEHAVEALYPHSINHGHSKMDLLDATVPKSPRRAVLGQESPPENFLKKDDGDEGEDQSPLSLPEILMTQGCFRDLMSDLTGSVPERAGMLFGPENQEGLIVAYCPDEMGKGTPTSFSLNGEFINSKIRDFSKAGMSLRGFVHSHPPLCTQLSGGDLEYVSGLIAKPENTVDYVFMPIVCKDRFLPFIVDENLSVFSPQVSLV